MSFILDFKGGVARSARGVNEKFMLFAIIGNSELHFHQVVQNGMVQTYTGSPEELEKRGFPLLKTSDTKYAFYNTDIKYWKLLLTFSQHGKARRSHILVFELLSDVVARPYITINPLSKSILEDEGVYDSYKVGGKISFVPRDSWGEILNEYSYDIAMRMSPLPIPIIKKIISVDKSALTKNVRQIRFRK